MLEEDCTKDDRLPKIEFDTEPEPVGGGIRKRGAKELSKSDESRISRSKMSARPSLLLGL